MMDTLDILKLTGAAALAIMMLLVVRARKQSHGRFMHEYAEREVCGHLQPALKRLLERGHRVARAGQRGPDMPLEIHIEPAFDPAEVYAQAGLEPPVHVSERNVLYCRDDWCELHPLGR